MSSELEERNADPDGYYAILMVPPTAKPSDINMAYRRQSELCHPDKSAGVPELQCDATLEQYHKICEAHFVLCDPVRRHAYDTLGKRGLEYLEMTPQQPSQSPPHQVRNELERAIRVWDMRRNYQELVDEMGAHGAYRIDLDFSRANWKDAVLGRDSARTQLFGEVLDNCNISLTQKVAVQLGESDNSSSTCIVKGTASPHATSFKAKLKHQWGIHNYITAFGSVQSKLIVVGCKVKKCFWQKWILSSGIQHVINPLGILLSTSQVCKVLANCLERIHNVVPTVLQGTSNSIVQSLSGLLLRIYDLSFSSPFADIIFSLRRILTATSDVYVRFKISPYNSAVNIGYRQWKDDSVDGHKTAECSLALSSQQVAVANKYRIDLFDKRRNFSISTSADLATGTCSCEYSLLARISKQTFFGVGAAYTHNTHTFCLYFTRLDHHIMVPMLITHSNWSSLLFIAPLIAMLTTKVLVVNPIKRVLKVRSIQQRRVQEREHMLEKREHALIIHEMLRQKVVDKIRTKEESVPKGGLIIINAKYGCLKSKIKPSKNSTNPPPVFDVTVPCQCWVTNSSLQLSQGSKSTLYGFYNPDPLGDEQKYLEIRYLFKGEEHRVEIFDEEALEIPQARHAVEDSDEDDYYSD